MFLVDNTGKLIEVANTEFYVDAYGKYAELLPATFYVDENGKYAELVGGSSEFIIGYSRMQYPYNTANNNYPTQAALYFYTDDDGQTLQQVNVLTPEYPSVYNLMCIVKDDVKYLVASRVISNHSTGRGTHEPAITYSVDNGATWTVVMARPTRKWIGYNYSMEQKIHYINGRLYVQTNETGGEDSSGDRHTYLQYSDDLITWVYLQLTPQAMQRLLTLGSNGTSDVVGDAVVGPYREYHSSDGSYTAGIYVIDTKPSAGKTTADWTTTTVSRTTSTEIHRGSFASNKVDKAVGVFEYYKYGDDPKRVYPLYYVTFTENATTGLPKPTVTISESTGSSILSACGQSSLSNSALKFCYGNGVWVACAIFSSVLYCFYSSNLSTWTKSTVISTTASVINNIKYMNDAFYCSLNNGYIYVSSDKGKTWTLFCERPPETSSINSSSSSNVPYCEIVGLFDGG